METLLNGGRRLLRLQLLPALVFFFACIPTALCQQGFLSIDCGSDESYKETSTGIFWSTDAHYTLTGRNVQVQVLNSVVGGPVVNEGQVGTLRYFDEPRDRYCYTLPVQAGDTYLLRLTFYFGNLSVNDYGSFEVWLDYNNWLNLDWQEGTNRFYSNYFELIYSPPRSTLNLCLAKLQGRSAFISALELRLLATGMYEAVVGPKFSSWLRSLERINCGANMNGAIQFWRYPNDTYDRIWTLADYDRATLVSNHNISGSSSTSPHDPDLPPLVVMEDGWVTYNSDILAVLESRPGNPVESVYIAAYFQELDGNASTTKVRGMNYYLNNEFIQSFNTSDEPLEIYTTGNIQDPYLNMTFVQAGWSQLGPVLNAFEVYNVEPYYNSSTIDKDVTALQYLQLRLNLSDWTGDPCLPQPFEWLVCSATSPFRITGLSLANQQFKGNIPLEIVDLTMLTILNLSNNNFSGPIPDFSSLVHLEAIDLQVNELNGEIPNFLGTAFPNLTQLNLDNNNLSGTLPADLIKPGLNFTVLNNPLIENCHVSACGVVPPAPSGNSNSIGGVVGAVVGGILGGLIALGIVTWIVWMICTRKRRARSSIIKAIEHAGGLSPMYEAFLVELKCSENQRSLSEIPLSNRKGFGSSIITLTLQEVSEATKMFSKKLGEGSFGPVYHGKLWDGQEVAVKVKKTDSRQGAIEFLNEVELLSRIHHRNLVSLVGYCDEENQQILVYVYFSNGTLSDHLYGDKSRKSLGWNTRLDIALNAAKGLEYLHTDCHPRIIHRDVKSSNILLDENMVAKVADFGISKQTPEGVFTGVSTILKGTIGYLDPAYFTSQRLTQKSDVYSFGVVLLEIISGRHPYIMERPNGTSTTLIEWVYGAVNNGNAMDIVDPSLKGRFIKESMMEVLSLAISSIDPLTAKRPTMAQVVCALTNAIELEHSPKTIQQTKNGNGASSMEDIREEPESHLLSLEILPTSDNIAKPRIIHPR